MSTAQGDLSAPSTCPACGRLPHDSFTLSNGEHLMRCPGCGLGWWKWGAFDPAGFYDQGYFQSAEVARGYSDYQALEPGLRATARARLRRLGRWLASRVDPGTPPSLLDLGCGTGVFLDQARQAGYGVSGVEVSGYAGERARARGLEVTVGAVETWTVPQASFDVITMWDVIEHLRDPVAVVQVAARGLKPGGVLALSTGDIDSWCARLSGRGWHLFNLPEHLFFFSSRSLHLLLEHAGLVSRQSVRETNWVPLRYIAERLAKTLTGRDRRVPLGRLRDWVVPATLGDVIGLYAVRPITPATGPDLGSQGARPR